VYFGIPNNVKIRNKKQLGDLAVNYLVMLNKTNKARFEGGDYEECRLLGYKTPVYTSRETHYIPAT
jgi:hypothetical protein